MGQLPSLESSLFDVFPAKTKRICDIDSYDIKEKTSTIDDEDRVIDLTEHQEEHNISRNNQTERSFQINEFTSEKKKRNSEKKINKNNKKMVKQKDVLSTSDEIDEYDEDEK